jgi:hypothetical protein
LGQTQRTFLYRAASASASSGAQKPQNFPFFFFFAGGRTFEKNEGKFCGF